MSAIEYSFGSKITATFPTTLEIDKLGAISINNEPVVPNCVIKLVDINSGVLHYLGCYVQGDFFQDPLIQDSFMDHAREVDPEWLGKMIVGQLHIDHPEVVQDYIFHSILLTLNTVPGMTGYINDPGMDPLVDGVFVGPTEVETDDDVHSGIAIRVESTSETRLYMLHTVFDQLPWNSDKGYEYLCYNNLEDAVLESFRTMIGFKFIDCHPGEVKSLNLCIIR